MVLTALDDNLRNVAAEATDNQDETLKKSRESVENAADLSIIVSSDDEDQTDAVRDVAKPPRPAAAPSRAAKKQAASQQQAAARRRRRRRSSARFLRLTGRFEEEDDEEEEDVAHQEHQGGQEHLGEMYKRAIRMNAENRINAGNSWGLRLIENIDKFLVDDEQHETEGHRVNFTKASCTLDASVKIYSYRVDDVHLTSYKVLANLNRTETGKKQQTRGDDEEVEDGAEAGDESNARTHKKSKSSNERCGVTETLESNVANLNMSKLDSAFDIDPLFHKMSKTFDEGGAKGLLLVNLGVGTSGCNIVFDSKEEATSIASPENAPPNEAENRATLRKAEGMIDISSLKTKLDSLLNGESIQSIPLVPQLKSLRQEYDQLEKEGFVDYNAPKTNSRRYASSQEEEKEAEMSIHQEALERSRASQGTLAQHPILENNTVNEDEDDLYAADDFGGGDDDDFGFSDFVEADENGQRYSSISFQDEAFVDGGAPPESKTNTTALLDAICSGNALGRSNDYEFFNAATVEKMTSGNVWAGSAHWKKTATPSNKKKRAATPKKKTKRSNKKKVIKSIGVIDFSKTPCLDDVLRTAPKNKRGTDPLQLSKANRTKYGKTNNLLPPDAGIGIEQLSTLFLRPNTVLGKVDEENRGKTKTVGFQDNVESFGAGFDYGGDDDSFGGGDDGPGFAFADSGDDDFVIGELDGVRKVDKIKVGYATVAKKVDVRRLKKDLWSELEATFAPPPADANNKKDDSMDEDDNSTADATETPAPAANEPKVLSFQKTVSDMEAKQSQGDVTVPFYFICLLHLANEKGLRLESTGLEDFVIQTEDGSAPSFVTLPNETATGESSLHRAKRTKEVTMYVDSESDTDAEEEGDETDSDSE